MQPRELQASSSRHLGNIFTEVSVHTQLARHNWLSHKLIRDEDQGLLTDWKSGIVNSADLLFHVDEATWNNIHDANRALTPETLSEYFPDYSAFRRSPLEDSLLLAKDGIPIHPDKLVIAYLGPSAGGKDTMLDILMSWYDYITRVKTDTTRKRRVDKKESPDAYNFVSHEYLRELGVKNRLIEGLIQGSDIYATEILEVIRAVRSAHRVTFWRGDIIGYEKFKQFCDLLGLDHVCVVVLPGLTDEQMHQRIVEKRGDEPQQQWRFAKARYEVQEFAKHADYIIFNEPLPPDKMSLGPVEATRALEYLTLKLIGYEGPLDHQMSFG